MSTLPIGLNALAAGKSISAQDAADATPSDDFARMLAPRLDSATAPRPRPASEPQHAEHAPARERTQAQSEHVRARHARHDDDANHAHEHHSHAQPQAGHTAEPPAKTQSQETSAAASADELSEQTSDAVESGEQLWPPAGLAGLGLSLPAGQGEASIAGQTEILASGAAANPSTVATATAAADAALLATDTALTGLASQNPITGGQALSASTDMLLAAAQDGALQLDPDMLADSQSTSLDFAQLLSPDIDQLNTQDATLSALGISSNEILQTQASADGGILDLSTAASLHAGPATLASSLRGLDAAIFDGDPTPIPQLHGEDFDDAVGSRLSWLAEQKIGHAHIKLNPNDLGPVEVHLQLDGDKVDASFTSAHAEVRQALEQSLPRLRDMLGQHGFQLGNADVGQQHHGDGDARAAALADSSGELASGEELDSAAISPLTLRQRGLLDAYA